MTVFERVKKLCQERGITLQTLAEKTNMSINSLYKWKTSKPSIDKLEAVADFFDVSTDYLLGRDDNKKYYNLTDKDERDIQKELENMIKDLSNGGALAFSKDGGEMSEVTREALIISLENSLRIAKIEAKKKFTPNKYRD